LSPLTRRRKQANCTCLEVAGKHQGAKDAAWEAILEQGGWMGGRGRPWLMRTKRGLFELW